MEVWGALRIGRPAGRRGGPAGGPRPGRADGPGPPVRRSPARACGCCWSTSSAGSADPDAFAFRCLTARRAAAASRWRPRLSAREQDVLAQLVSLSNLGEIAEDLDVSVNTVKSHVRAIYGKLGVNTRRAAVLTALEHAVLT